MPDNNEEKKSNGRPKKYKKEYNEQVYKLCLLGATDDQLADFFNVCTDTIHNWKKTEIGFFDSIKKGKLQADSEIANSLFHRARGYEHPEVKVFHNSMALNKEERIVKVDLIKHYAPDPAAIIFWLKNRQPKAWRDKQEVEANNTNTNTNMNISVDSNKAKDDMEKMDDM